MENNKLKESVYKGCTILLTTKHAKEEVIAPSFMQILQSEVRISNLDTDTLGTFTGEVERKGTPLECVRKKCLWGIEKENAEYGIASEGSFGPHPMVPFMPCNHEILYFMDKKRNFELHLTSLSFKTNYLMKSIQSLDELNEFVDKVLFPSHALIIRPDIPGGFSYLVKGIQSKKILEDAFNKAKKLSPEGKVWVETDMRAHMNPSRMRVIAELSFELAQRLLKLCPECGTPGFGKVRIEYGLICRECGSKTQQIKSEIWGCKKCPYEEFHPREDGLKEASPGDCFFCNP